MKQYIKNNLTVPNALSFLRIIIIPPMARFLLKQDYILAGLMLLISAVSDALDGLIARKFNQITQLGKILDPIADKLTLISLVICVNILYPDILLFVLVMFVKELLMLFGGGVLLVFRIRPPAAKWFGKIATILFYTSVITIVMLNAVWSYTNRTLTILLFALTAFMMLFSLVMYSVMFINLIKEKRKEVRSSSGVALEGSEKEALQDDK